MFNGFDFHDQRTAKLKKIGVIEQFFTHFNSVNKRIQCFSGNLENISIFQLQVFQSRFDFQLNQEYLQNATFICSAPWLASQRENIDANPAILAIKETFLKNLLQDTSEYEKVKKRLNTLNAQMSTLDLKFQNSFLIASGETLKKLVDYHQLKTSVEDIIEARQERNKYQKIFNEMLGSIHLLSEASKVIYNIFISMKHVSKILNEVTYSWNQFIKIVDMITCKIISKKK